MDRILAMISQRLGLFFSLSDPKKQSIRFDSMDPPSHRKPALHDQVRKERYQSGKRQARCHRQSGGIRMAT